MSDPHAAGSVWLIVTLWVFSVIEQLHPGAASGASFGCFFFLAFPDPQKGTAFEQTLRKIVLLIGSWGAGYATGAALAQSANWSAWAMPVAVIISALAAAIIGALNLTVRNDAPLPQWLSNILNRIPILKRGDDGQ